MPTAQLPQLDVAQSTRWLFEREHIWQMKLLDARELGRFVKDRAVDFDKDDIHRLWQMGLFKADLILSDTRLRRVGLIFIGKDIRGRYAYADNRQLRLRKQGWENVAVGLPTFPRGVVLYFHPFRYYTLYHLGRAIKSHIDNMQLFYTKYYQRTVDSWLSYTLQWSASKGAIDTLNRWNLTSTFVMLAEPCFFEDIYHKIIMRGFLDEGEVRKDIAEHWNDVYAIYQAAGLETLDTLVDNLCIDADFLDGNREVYSMLRLAAGDVRLQIEDRLGGALLFRSMAEIVRRAAERIYNQTLREEDERGLGWTYPGVKKQLYGADRLFDGDRNAAGNYMSHHQLNFGVKISWYVEGPTEYGALYSVCEQHGATGIQVVDLKGQFVQKRDLSFRDSLEADIRSKRFSFISFDADVKDNVRVVQRAAQDDVICGNVYIATPDFECSNFTLDELEEILWTIATEDEQMLEDHATLHETLQGATSGKQVWEKAQRALPILKSKGKSKEWGERLMHYAGEHPYKSDGQLRPIIEALNAAFEAAYFDNYDLSRSETKVDPITLKTVQRKTADDAQD